MNVRMTAAMCVVAALVAVPEASADHGSAGADDNVALTTVTATNSGDDSQGIGTTDATARASESGDDSTEATPAPDQSAQPEQETDSSATTSGESETEDGQPAAVATFASPLRNQRVWRTHHSGNSGHRGHKH